MSGEPYVPQDFDFISRVHEDGVINPLSLLLVIGVNLERGTVSVRAWHRRTWSYLEMTFDDLHGYMKEADAVAFRPIDEEFVPKDCDIIVTHMSGIPDFNFLQYLFDKNETKGEVDVYTLVHFIPYRPPDRRRLSDVVDIVNWLPAYVYRAISQ